MAAATATSMINVPIQALETVLFNGGRRQMRSLSLPLRSDNNKASQIFPSLHFFSPTQNFTVLCLPSPRLGSQTHFNPSTKLFVSGLSFRTTEESLRNAFKSFGQLLEVNLVMDKIANRPKGFAFIRYATEEESQKAIEGMHGKVKMPSDVLGRDVMFLDCVIFLEMILDKEEEYIK